MRSTLHAESLRDGMDVEGETLKIYCYRVDGSELNDRLVRVGATSKSVHQRVARQVKSMGDYVDYEILHILPAITASDGSFRLQDVHRALKSSGIASPRPEWFDCDARTVKSIIRALQTESSLPGTSDLSSY